MLIPRWRYRLVSLSAQSSPSSPQRPPSPPPAGKAAPQEQPFTRSFLQQQFPEYYGDKASRPLPTGGGLAELVDLFNRLGADGWEYHSREEIGGYSLLIFRKPLTPPPEEASPQAG